VDLMRSSLGVGITAGAGHLIVLLGGIPLFLVVVDILLPDLIWPPFIDLSRSCHGIA